MNDSIIPNLNRLVSKNTNNAKDFVDMKVRCLPNFQDVYGYLPDEQLISSLLSQRSLFDWLSYSSRIVAIIQRSDTLDPKIDLFPKIFSIDQQHRIKCRFKNESCKTEATSPWALSFLQQLAIYHNYPISDSEGFSSEKGIDLFGRAVLISNGLITTNSHEKRNIDVISDIFHSMIRSESTDINHALLKFNLLFGIGSPFKSTKLRRFADSRTEILGIDINEYLLAGLYLYLAEAVKTPERLKQSWEHLSEKVEKECYHYIKPNCKSVKELSTELLNQKKENLQSMILVRQFPIIYIPGYGRFVLSIHFLLESLIDSLRFKPIFVTSKNDKLSGQKRKSVIQQLNGEYGEVFEEYAHKLLKELFIVEVKKIPENRFPGCVDFIAISQNNVFLIEVKSKRSSIKSIYEADSVERWKGIFQDKLSIASKQFEKTINMLLLGKFSNLIPSIDWTTSSILPILLCEEFITPMPGSESELLLPFYDKFKHFSGKTKVMKPRILNISNTESLLGLPYKHRIQLTSFLFHWANDRFFSSGSFLDFLYQKKIFCSVTDSKLFQSSKEAVLEKLKVFTARIE